MNGYKNKNYNHKETEQLSNNNLYNQNNMLNIQQNIKNSRVSHQPLIVPLHLLKDNHAMEIKKQMDSIKKNHNNANDNISTN